jgi:hypothetical protein
MQAQSLAGRYDAAVQPARDMPDQRRRWNG